MSDQRKSSVSIRVRYAETDRMGVGYYANYPIWFEVGRAEYMRQAGVPYDRLEREGYFLPVVHLNVDYRSPAFYDDELQIVSTIKEIGPRKLVFQYRVERDGALLAEGSTVHVCTDKDAKARRLPEAVLKALSGAGSPSR